MRDVRVAERAGEQFNRVSSAQLRALGASRKWVFARVKAGRLVRVAPGVYAVPPVLDDDRGRWMGATLLGAGGFLSHLSAAVAWGMLSIESPLTTVSQTGRGGRRRVGEVLIHRSSTLEGHTTALDGIPITTPARTLIDIASQVSRRALARAVREAVRLEVVTLSELADVLERHRGARGARAVRATLDRYRGLPIGEARSGAEVRALEILQAAGRPMPLLNRKVAGERPDLQWPKARLIIEIDGGPFHLDVGEDARKQAIWGRAGWKVARISSDDVYADPSRLVALFDSNSSDVPVDGNEAAVRLAEWRDSPHG